MHAVEVTGSGPSLKAVLRDPAFGSTATILVGFGCNCISFVCPVGNGPAREFIYCDPSFPSETAKPSHHGIPILAPFPNRIRQGRFSADGKEYSLPTNLKPNAIHGLVIDRPWRIVATGSGKDVGAFVTGEIERDVDLQDVADRWPCNFRLRVRYQLQGAKLTSDIIVTNPDGNGTLPFGIGTHPYFRFPLEPTSTLADCEIVSPASQVVELDACLPTGRIVPATGLADLRNGLKLDQRTFDDVFTGLTYGDSEMVEHKLVDHKVGAELVVRHDPEFRYSVIYTPPHRQAICIEPYTCVTDAINLDRTGMPTGWWRLRPGDVRTLRIEHEVRVSR